jgi:hypothetical protein
MTTIRRPSGVAPGLRRFLEHASHFPRRVADHLSARRCGPTTLAGPRSESCRALEENGLYTPRVDHWVRLEWL